MIAVDTNILVHAHRREMPLHSEATKALRELAEGEEAWGLPVCCAVEFVRVVTHPSVFRPPTTADRALLFIDRLLESPSVLFMVPGSRFWPLFEVTVDTSGVAGNRVFDARIVATCLENGAQVVLSEDRDLARFDGIEARTLSA